MAYSNMDAHTVLPTMQWISMDGETSLIALAVFAALALLLAFVTNSVNFPGLELPPYLKFVWANLLKPHEKTSVGQQSALESFYAASGRLFGS